MEILIDCSLSKIEITTMYAQRQKCNLQTALNCDSRRIPSEQWTTEGIVVIVLIIKSTAKCGTEQVTTSVFGKYDPPKLLFMLLAPQRIRNSAKFLLPLRQTQSKEIEPNDENHRVLKSRSPFIARVVIPESTPKCSVSWS